MSEILRAMAGYGVRGDTNDKRNRLHRAWCQDRRYCQSPECHEEEKKGERTVQEGQGKESRPSHLDSWTADRLARQTPTGAVSLPEVRSPIREGVEANHETAQSEGPGASGHRAVEGNKPPVRVKKKHGQRGPDKKPRKRRGAA